MALKFETLYGSEKVDSVTDEKIVFTGGKFHPASGGQGKFILMLDPFGREATLKSGDTTKNAIYNSVAHAYYAHMAKFAAPKDTDETAADWHDYVKAGQGPQDLRERVSAMKRECVIDWKRWDKVKDQVLTDAMLARYTNDLTAQQLLLATKEKALEYKSSRDTEFSTDNRLGRITGEVRELIRKEKAEKAEAAKKEAASS